jgi:putative ABC transport system substrate-binding protein
MIVASGGGRTLPLLKRATTTIPVIMTAAPDPLSDGLAQSLAHPGGNFTGMSLQSLELTGKRLALLRELVPTAQSMAFFDDSTNPKLWPVVEAFGRTQGWKPLRIGVADRTKIAMAFKAAEEEGAQALFIPASGLLFSQATQIAKLAAQRRLPAMYELRPFVDAGGLMSYGAQIEDIWKRAAIYADKLLKGAHPADLPIEQPTKFELVINQAAAKALGLNLPSSFLIRADELID